MTTQQINEQQARFCPYGYIDVEVALKLMQEYGLDGEFDLYDLCFDEAESLEGTGITIDKLDPVAVVYEYIYRAVSADISNNMDVDIEEMVFVHSNYSASSWDNTNEWAEWLEENKWKWSEDKQDEEGNVYDQLDEMTIYFLNQF